MRSRLPRDSGRFTRRLRPGSAGGNTTADHLTVLGCAAHRNAAEAPAPTEGHLRATGRAGSACPPGGVCFLGLAIQAPVLMSSVRSTCMRESTAKPTRSCNRSRPGRTEQATGLPRGNVLRASESADCRRCPGGGCPGWNGASRSRPGLGSVLSAARPCAVAWTESASWPASSGSAGRSSAMQAPGLAAC